MTGSNAPIRARFGAAAAVIAVLGSLVVTAGPAAAAPGDLDVSFGGGGVVNGPSGSGLAIARQPDGKLVVAGSVIVQAFTPSNNDIRVARFNTDGTLDTSFSGDGVVNVDFTPSDAANAVAIQSDGKVVVAGGGLTAATGQDVVLARFNTDGTLDTGFDGDGKVTTVVAGGAGSDQAFGIAMQNDGGEKILVAGLSGATSATNDFLLLRYNTTNGSLDTTFDTDGIVTTDFATTRDEASAVVVQPDNKAVVVGCTGGTCTSSPTTFGVARYNTNGSLDTTFDTDGKLTGPLGRARTVALQSDGNIVVGGQTGTTSTNTTLARYTPTGAPDTTFDTDGIVTATGIATRAVGVQGDGKIVTGGAVSGDFVVGRYTATGAPDTTFDGDGRAVTDFGPQSTPSLLGLVIQPTDGKVVAAGTSEVATFVLARYEVAGGPDTADLSVTMTDTPDPVAAGANLTYNLNVTNLGPQNAYGISLVDTLPAGVDLVSATSSQGFCVQGVGSVTCTLRGLASSASASVTIVLNALPGAISNSATVTTTSTEGNPANNTAASTTTVVEGAGAWNAANSLSGVRAAAGAVVLADGRVLVSGGLSATATVNTAEIFDPATGSWTSTANMATARSAHSLTLLADGRVLAAGGSPFSTAKLAELWNPSSGLWTPAGTMAVEHTTNATVLLNDGKVLLVGGNDLQGTSCPGASGVTSSAELYDPVTNLWSSTGNLVFSRQVGHSLTKLNDGRVLAVGGYVGTNYASVCATLGEQNAAVEVYDPGTGTWSQPADTTIRRNKHSATLLTDGTVLVAGGNNCNGTCPTTSVERYSPVTNTWTPATALPRPRFDHRALRLGDGKTLLFGGQGTLDPLGSAPYVRGAALFDPIAGSWSGAGLLGTPRTAPAVVIVHNRVLAIGGQSTSRLSTVEMWTPRPVLTNVTPTSAAHGVTIDLTGTGLVTAASASFGGVSTTAVTHNVGSPDTILHVVVPADAPNAQVALTATSPGGTSDPILFTVLGGTFTPLTPVRILDTRAGFTTGTCFDNGGSPVTCSALAANQPKQVQITGTGGVPASGVSAVVLNVTAVTPSGNSWLTVWPADQAEPLASNLNYTAGTTIPNLVTVKLSANGRVKINDPNSSVEVLFDVAGWYSDGSGPAGSRFNPLAPVRILDTRAGFTTGTCFDNGGSPVTCSALAANQPKQVQITGTGGVPASGVSAVVLNVTAVTPSGNSWLTVWPADQAEPLASNLNYTAGTTIPNLVTVKLSANGRVKVNDPNGSVEVLFDVAGWYGAAGSGTGSRFTPVTPTRALDTRAGFTTGTCYTDGGSPTACTTLSANQPKQVQVGSVAGVPATGATAVVMNVTAVTPSNSSWLTVWPADQAEPLASNLNYTAGKTIPNLAAVKLSPNGRVKVNDPNGSVEVLFDVAGWFNDGT